MPGRMSHICASLRCVSGGRLRLVATVECPRIALGRNGIRISTTRCDGCVFVALHTAFASFPHCALHAGKSALLLLLLLLFLFNCSHTNLVHATRPLLSLSSFFIILYLNIYLGRRTREDGRENTSRIWTHRLSPSRLASHKRSGERYSLTGWII